MSTPSISLSPKQQLVVQAALRSYRRNDKDFNATAVDLGVTRRTLSRWLLLGGIDVTSRGSKIPAANKEAFGRQLYDLYLQHRNTYLVAEIAGTSEATVSNYLRLGGREGWFVYPLPRSFTYTRPRRSSSSPPLPLSTPAPSPTLAATDSASIQWYQGLVRRLNRLPDHGMTRLYARQERQMATILSTHLDFNSFFLLARASIQNRRAFPSYTLADYLIEHLDTYIPRETTVSQLADALFIQRQLARKILQKLLSRGVLVSSPVLQESWKPEIFTRV